MIYFIQAGPGGPIKIGFTKYAVEGRMAALQTGNPVALKLLGTREGTVEDEADLHERFDFCRLRGEWFYPTEDLLEFIVEGPWWRPKVPQIHRQAIRILKAHDSGRTTEEVAREFTYGDVGQVLRTIHARFYHIRCVQLAA